MSDMSYITHKFGREMAANHAYGSHTTSLRTLI